MTPDQVVASVPFLEKDQIIGAFWTPSVGVVDSLRAGTIMRERAMELDALTVVPNVEVTGMDVEQGRIRRVHTTGGDIEAETVVIACGVWSPKIAKMAGAAIPLTPAVHQMISVGPIPQLAERPGEISFPIVRDMDTFCYERQHGADMEVGSYAHRAILHDPSEIPSIEQAKLSPTEMPFTADDFDPQLEQALELMPDALGAEGAEIRYAINGLLSLTPDGLPILGETPEVKGLWSAAAVWIKEGPGTARAVAEWMTHGHSEIDVHHSDIARFYPHQRTRSHVRSRTSEAFNKTYGIVHPSSSGTESAASASRRCTRPSATPVRCSSRPRAGNGRCGTRRNESLLGEYGDAVMPREHEWDSRWWSPIINAEHLAMRERAGIFDLSAFAIFDIVGPAAEQAVQSIVVTQADVADGRVIYTPVLDAKGGFRSDLTVMRLAHDHYRVVTGGAHGMADRSGSPTTCPPAARAIVDQTSAFSTIGLWGPKARDILGRVTDDDISHSGFPFLTSRTIELGSTRCWPRGSPTSASWAGSCTSRWSRVPAVWRLLHEAGRPRRRGAGRHRRLRHHRPPGEGLPGVRLRAGRGAVDHRGGDGAPAGQGRRLHRPRGVRRPARRRTADGAVHADRRRPQSENGVARYMLGGEPILTATAAPHRRARAPPVRHVGGSAPSLGKHILLAYLPPDQAVVGNQLAVSYMEELYPVTSAQRRDAAVRPVQRADQGLRR